MKHKYLSILLLSSQLCLLEVTQVRAAEFDKQPPGPVMGEAGHTQSVLAPGNLKVIESFRQFYQKFSDGSGSDVSMAEPYDSFIPYAQHLLTSMNKNEPSAHLQVLVKEVKEHIDDKRVSPNWLFDMHFRYVVVQGDMTDEERELVDHVPHHKYIQALLAKDMHGKPIVLDLYKWGAHLDKQGEYYHDQGENVSIFPGTSDESLKQVEQEIARQLPAPIIYPSLGEAILPMKLIIRNWFKEIYQVAFPDKTASYHGLKNVSLVGFAFHDLFHYKIDQRRFSLETYIMRMVGQGVMGHDHFAVDIIPKFVELVVQKYCLIMEALEKAYLALEEDPLAVTGFFNMIHELEKNFSPEFFNMSNPNMILEAMLKAGVDHYSDYSSWENPEDPLNTGLEGQSQLKDEDIITVALNNLVEDPSITLPYQIYEKRNEKNEFVEYVQNPEEKRQIGLKWLSEKTRKTVTRLAQFVDVKFSFQDGREKTISFPTLKRKWVNVDASLGLLHYAGLKDLVKPQLSGKDKSADRTDALNFVALIKTRLEGTMSDFVEKAKGVFNEGAGASSYSVNFEDRFNAIDEKLMDIVGIG
jgi:hypothetical protein